MNTKTLRWVLLAAILWFAPLNAPHLFDPDEGRYGEIPREMLATGDWVTPRLDAIKYFEKPPLQYWSTAGAMAVFGEHPWTVRLWPALCGFGGLLLTWALGRRFFGARAGWISAAVQASALLYIAMARIATLDMGLCFALELTLGALLCLNTARASASERRLAPWVLGLGAAMAVLTKGLVGVLVPGAVAVLDMLVARDARLLVRARPWWGALVLLVIAAPWFVLVSHRNPEFAHFFFIFQHFQRFLNVAGFDRYQPAWFFVPILLAGMLPWTGWLPSALRDGVRAARAGDAAARLLLLWALFVLLFFSASKSKLVPYILPLVPALSLLIGRTVAAATPTRVARHAAGVAIGALAIAVSALVVARMPQAAGWVAEATLACVDRFALAIGALGVGAVFAARLARRERPAAAIVCLALGVWVMADQALRAADALPPKRAVIELIAHVKPELGPGTVVYCVHDYVQPLPLAIERPCTLVGYRGELDFGLQQEPWRFVENLSQFSRRWAAEHDALAVLRPADLAGLQSLGTPLRVIYTAKSFIVIRRP